MYKEEKLGRGKEVLNFLSIDSGCSITSYLKSLFPCGLYQGAISKEKQQLSFLSLLLSGHFIKVTEIQLRQLSEIKGCVIDLYSKWKELT